MASPIVTAPMRRKAEALAELLPTFSHGRSKLTGQAFIVVPASNRKSAHWTAIDGSGCTCLGWHRRGLCTHAIAAKIVADRQAAVVAPAPKPLSRYAALYPKCHGCDDLADTRDGWCDRCASDREWQARRAS